MSARSRVLLVCCPFGHKLPGAAVAQAVQAGLRAAGGADTDVLALESASEHGEDAQRLLAHGRFDARMLASRALVLVLRRLEPRALAGSLTLEIATRARQSGVPAYAIACESRIDAFDARMLDLQVILTACDARALRDAGRTLTGLL